MIQSGDGRVMSSHDRKVDHDTEWRWKGDVQSGWEGGL